MRFVNKVERKSISATEFIALLRARGRKSPCFYTDIRPLSLLLVVVLLYLSNRSILLS